MSVLRVNKITNEAGTGGPEFSKGVTFPSSQTFGDDLKINSTGIGTFTTLSVTTDANVSGTVTATSYKGSGLSLTNLAGSTTGKAIALQLIT